ncbi:replication endonuclease [Ferrimonas gelatinilytica]|uniref:Replication endonuclease n=1 Tax=Ferrimonas gelatinilytica TaxID=1255257 RepID=A0ABP9S653_9GAMM
MYAPQTVPRPVNVTGPTPRYVNGKTNTPPAFPSRVRQALFEATQLVPESLLVNVEWQDRDFVERHLRGFPHDIQVMLMAAYSKLPTRQERNLFLLRTVKAIKKKLGGSPRNEFFDLSDTNLKITAKQNARFCLSLRKSNPDDDSLLPVLMAYAKRQTVILRPTTQVKGSIARACCEDWWYRQLKKAVKRNREVVYLSLNRVNRFAGIYCSHWQAQTARQQRYITDLLLEETVLINEQDQQYTLKELSALNVSNPKVRRAELMVRARGFEEFAELQGDEGLFITISCPSRFHRAYSKTGHPNEKWDGSTPKDGQAYLRSCWAKTRSDWQRKGLRPYGFRIAEPQHDGTPHWHLLLFAPKSQHQALIDTIRHYALQMDGDEPGAAEHRVDVKLIDKEKGSAAGYIAKYICKNIDGENLNSGVYGEDPIEAAERVRAWASCWGIRQFQQIGGASVTVWRELRRLKANMVAKGTALAKAWHAADDGDWAAYLKVMLGVPLQDVSPKGENSAKGHSVPSGAIAPDDPIASDEVHPVAAKGAIAPLYEVRCDGDTGEIRTNRYDGTFSHALKGITYLGQKLVTRYHEWRRLDALALGAASLGVL